MVLFLVILFLTSFACIGPSTACDKALRDDTNDDGFFFLPDSVKCRFIHRVKVHAFFFQEDTNEIARRDERSLAINAHKTFPFYCPNLITRYHNFFGLISTARSCWNALSATCLTRSVFWSWICSVINHFQAPVVIRGN